MNLTAVSPSFVSESLSASIGSLTPNTEDVSMDQFNDHLQLWSQVAGDTWTVQDGRLSRGLGVANAALLHTKSCGYKCSIAFEAVISNSSVGVAFMASDELNYVAVSVTPTIIEWHNVADGVKVSVGTPTDLNFETPATVRLEFYLDGSQASLFVTDLASSRISGPATLFLGCPGSVCDIFNNNRTRQALGGAVGVHAEEQGDAVWIDNFRLSWDASLTLPVAFSDGAATLTAEDYREGATNGGAYVVPCHDFDWMGSNFTLTMLTTTTASQPRTDYFRPRSAGLTVCDVLTSHQNHLWSQSEHFVMPTYGVTGIGGGSVGSVTVPSWGVDSSFSLHVTASSPNFQGAISDLAIFDYALSPSQIRSIADVPTLCVPLQASSWNYSGASMAKTTSILSTASVRTSGETVVLDPVPTVNGGNKAAIRVPLHRIPHGEATVTIDVRVQKMTTDAQLLLSLSFEDVLHVPIALGTDGRVNVYQPQQGHGVDTIPLESLAATHATQCHSDANFMVWQFAQPVTAPSTALATIQPSTNGRAVYVVQKPGLVVLGSGSLSITAPFTAGLEDHIALAPVFDVSGEFALALRFKTSSIGHNIPARLLTHMVDDIGWSLRIDAGLLQLQYVSGTTEHLMTLPDKFISDGLWHTLELRRVQQVSPVDQDVPIPDSYQIEWSLDGADPIVQVDPLTGGVPSPPGVVTTEIGAHSDDISLYGQSSFIGQFDYLAFGAGSFDLDSLREIHSACTYSLRLTFEQGSLALTANGHHLFTTALALPTRQVCEMSVDLTEAHQHPGITVARVTRVARSRGTSSCAVARQATLFRGGTASYLSPQSDRHVLLSCSKASWGTTEPSMGF